MLFKILEKKFEIKDGYFYGYGGKTAIPPNDVESLIRDLQVAERVSFPASSDLGLVDIKSTIWVQTALYQRLGKNIAPSAHVTYEAVGNDPNNSKVRRSENTHFTEVRDYPAHYTPLKNEDEIIEIIKKVGCANYYANLRLPDALVPYIGMLESPLVAIKRRSLPVRVSICGLETFVSII